MEKFSTEYFRKLAHDIMFDISDQEIEELKAEFGQLLSQIEGLKEIDTEGVADMVYPFEEETSYVREDVVENVLSQHDALVNAKSVKAGHVHVPKVVK